MVAAVVIHANHHHLHVAKDGQFSDGDPVALYPRHRPCTARDKAMGSADDGLMGAYQGEVPVKSGCTVFNLAGMEVAGGARKKPQPQ